MTPSLTERLQERLSTERGEIEALTSRELSKLGASLRAESDAALASMQSTMAESLARTTRQLTRDLERLRGIGRWWSGTLLLSWATTLVLLASLLWLWMSPGWGWGASASGLDPYPTFTQGGQTYVVLPTGTQATTCRQGEQVRPCVVLPGPGTRPGSPPWSSGTGEDPTTGGPGTSEPNTEPSVRPPPRPGMPPGGERDGS